MFDFSITKKEIKGIDIIIKSIAKKYKFIKKWKLSDDYSKYKVTIFIDLYIDYELLSEFSGFEFDPYWKKAYLENPEKFARTSVFYVYFLPNNSKEKDKKSIELKENIINEINELYEHLPDGFMAKTNTEFGESGRIISLDNLIPITLLNEN